MCLLGIGIIGRYLGVIVEETARSPEMEREDVLDTAGLTELPLAQSYALTEPLEADSTLTRHRGITKGRSRTRIARSSRCRPEQPATGTPQAPARSVPIRTRSSRCRSG